MNIHAIIERLDKVRKNGNGYMACCPVHTEKTPSLSLTEKDGKILCHCFGCGADGIAVVEAIGLKPDVLFSEEMETEEGNDWILIENSLFDEEVINIAFNDMRRGDPICYSDYKLIRTSLARRQERYRRNMPVKHKMAIDLEGYRG